MEDALSAQTMTVFDTTLLEPSNGLLNPTNACLPVVKPEDKVASAIFTSDNDINPLVASASALFSLIPKLRLSKQYDDINELCQYLTHEIKAFESTAQQNGYYSETILLARYAICATLDEVISQTAWASDGAWDNKFLLNGFHGEIGGGERFFQVIEKLTTDPSLHIDTLEFYYTCMSMGFMGKYRTKEFGRTAFDEVMDKLYKVIRLDRGDFDKSLSLIPVNASKKQSITVQNIELPIWMLTILTSTLIMTLYSGFSYMLSTSITPLYQSVLSLQTAQPTYDMNAQNRH